MRLLLSVLLLLVLVTVVLNKYKDSFMLTLNEIKCILSVLDGDRNISGLPIQILAWGGIGPPP